MFRHRRVENAAHFPTLDQAIRKKTIVHIREDGPDAWGARIELPDHCWYCWEAGDTWFYIASQSHLWVTQKQNNNLFVLSYDRDGQLCCEHFIVRVLDDPD